MKRKPLLFVFLSSVWFILNIVQALFTEIGNDEAYYWVYSQNLDWGYFDHPPLIALIIKCGTMLFGQTTFGVRFFVTLSQFLFLWILFKLVNIPRTTQNIILFFIISFSVVMLQAYGFVATPDVPLLLFTALFLWSFKYYADTDYSWQGALWLSVCMAALMYSKYHGALIIFFVLLSDLKLFRKKSFYLSVLFAMVLFLPHILWQINHAFPSLQYHLVDRSKPFKWFNFVDFALNQFPVFNPFTLPAAIYVIFHRKNRSPFERSLKFLFVGFILFFTFWNFKSRVEPHWTIAAAIPMIILMVREASQNIKLKRYVTRIMAPSLLLLILMRFFLIFDILPIPTEWHGDKQRVADLKTYAKDRPVVYLRGFQMPSKYRFYTANSSGDASCVGVLNYRHTQYDFWRFDEAYWDKAVVINLRGDTPAENLVRINKNDFYLLPVEHYQPYKRLKVKPASKGSIALKTGQHASLPITIENPYDKTFHINHPEMPLQIYLVTDVKIDGKWQQKAIKVSARFDKEQIVAKETVGAEIGFTVPGFLTGTHHLLFAAGTPLLYPASLEKPIEIDFQK